MMPTGTHGQRLFTATDPSPYIQENEWPYLDRKIDLNSLVNEDKILSAATIEFVKKYFVDHKDAISLTLTDNNGNKFAQIIKLQDPVQLNVYRLFVRYRKSGLGAGSYGTVKLMQELDTGSWYAVKRIKFNPDLKDTDKDGPRKAASAVYEYENLALIRQTKGANLQTCKNGKEKKYLISLEFVPGRSLYQYLLEKPKLTPIRGLQIAVNLLKCVRELHEKNYLHRDINPNNVMLDTQTFGVRLVDFGFMHRALQSQDGAYYGTEGYIPFEAKLKTIHDVKSDIYSAGKTIQALPWWKDITDEDLKAKITTYIAKIASENKEDRPTTTDAISFLTNVQNEFVEVLDKIHKIGLIDMDEVLASIHTKNFDALVQRMKSMDIVWVMSTSNHSKKEYMELRRILEGYKINVGNKHFHSTYPLSPVEFLQGVAKRCEKTQNTQSLFYLTNKKLHEHQIAQLQKYRFGVLNKACDQEIINKQLSEQHLLREEYFYVRDVLMETYNEYKAAYMKTRVPKDKLLFGKEQLFNNIAKIDAEYNHGRLTVNDLFNVLKGCSGWATARFVTAIDHMECIEDKYYPLARMPAPITYFTL